MSPPDIEALREGLFRICLPAPSKPSPFEISTNVFVLRRTPQDGVGLINAGDVAHWSLLQEALQALGIRPREVSRIVATSYSPHLLGAASFMPWADLVLLRAPSTPRVSTPKLTADTIDAELKALSEVAAVLPKPWPLAPQPAPQPQQRPLAAPDKPRVKVVGARQAVSPAPSTDTEALQAHINQWRAFAWPLRLLYHPPDIALNLGGWRWNLIPTPGGGIAGQSWALWNPEERWLAAGDALHDQDEACWIRDVAALTQSLEDLRGLGAQWLLPNSGECSRRPDWTFRHTSLFLSNFLSHFPHALNEMTDLPTLVDRDLALASEPVAFAMAVLGYRAFAEAQVADGLIDAQGEGFLRTYGAAGVKRSRVMRSPAT